jgi:hypothetical protein
MASISGRCLCGAVRFAADVARLEVDACHCSMCRRWTSGPYLSVSCEGNVEFDGEANIEVYRSSSVGERAFCRRCGSALFWRMHGSHHYAFSAGVIEDQSGLAFKKQIFIDEKPPYYDFANDTERLTGEEVVASAEAQAKG